MWGSENSLSFLSVVWPLSGDPCWNSVRGNKQPFLSRLRRIDLLEETSGPKIPSCIQWLISLIVLLDRQVSMSPPWEPLGNLAELNAYGPALSSWNCMAGPDLSSPFSLFCRPTAWRLSAMQFLNVPMVSDTLLVTIHAIPYVLEVEREWLKKGWNWAKLGEFLASLRCHKSMHPMK